jgi:hypothetical protein
MPKKTTVIDTPDTGLGTKGDTVKTPKKKRPARNTKQTTKKNQ